MKTRTSLIVLALATSPLALACSSTDATEGSASAVVNSEERRIVSASRDPRFDDLGYLQAVHQVTGPNWLSIRALELRGGDAIMNGTSVLLAMSGGDGSDTIWDLHLHIGALRKLETLADGAVKLTGARDALDAEENTISVPFELIARYELRGGALNPKLVLEEGDSSREVTAESTESMDLLSGVYAVKTSDHGRVTARVYQSFFGDPGINGHKIHLALVTGIEPVVYDLGLNVASVKEVTSSEGQVRIEGMEHTLDRDEELVEKPFAYEVRYTLDAYRNPSREVQISRIR